MNTFVERLGPVSPQTLRLLMLGASVLILYGAGRLVFGAIPRRLDRPMLRALLGALAVLAVAVTAVAMGRATIALHLPIACAAAAMTFGVGSLILARPLPAAFAPDRSWALLVPAIAILLVGGYGGRLDAPLLGALALYGAVAVLAWTDAPQAPEGDADESPPHHPPRGPTLMTGVVWIGGALLVALAAVLAMLGLPGLEAARQLPSDALAVVFLLAPAIVVPMCFELLPPGRTLGWSGSMSSLVKFALVCLCFVLPAVALVQADADVIRGWAGRMSDATTLPAEPPTTLPHASPMLSPTSLPTSLPTTASIAASRPEAPTLVFPVVPAIALRADLLVLAGAALLTVPLAAGWQRPGRVEAAALVACYLLQLLLVMGSVLSG